MPSKRKSTSRRTRRRTTNYRLTSAREALPPPETARLPDWWSPGQKANWLMSVKQAREHIAKKRGGES